MEKIKSNVDSHIQILVDDLRAKVLLMATKCQQSLAYTCEALQKLDISLAQKSLDLEEELDGLEVEIDAFALNVLARTQPVASDLRLLISAIRMVVDLERIGDESANIANHVISIHEQKLVRLPELIFELANKADKIVDHAIQSFKDKSTTKVAELREEADQITNIAVKIIDYCSKALQTNELDGWLAMHYILIGHSLQRIASRGINIAEHTSFIVDGVSLKHVPINDNFK